MDLQPKDKQTLTFLSEILSGRRWQTSKDSHWVAIIGFGLLSLLIVGGGWWTYEHQKNKIRQDRQHELTAIASLKAQQISAWREEKLRDAELLRDNPILAQQFQEWQQKGAPSDQLYDKFRSRLSSLLRAYDYHALVMVDKKIQPLIYVGEKWALEKHLHKTALESLKTKQILFSELSSQHIIEPADDHVHLDLLIPLLAGKEKKPVGLIIIRLDPNRFLFPLVESWPTPSSSAETVLLKPTPTGVFRLTGRRHTAEGPTREIKFPKDRITPPMMVFKKQEGSLEHLDYRDVPTLTYVKRVESSPWFLVAKIDQAEIYAPINSLAWQMFLLVTALITATGLVVYYWWLQLHASFLASRYQSELEKNLLEQRFHSVTKYANDIILLVNQEGYIVDANNRAEEIYGYSFAELFKLRISDLRLPEDKDISIEQRQQLQKKGALTFEANFLRKDGSVFPAEVSARLIDLEGQTYFQGIIRDITERKKAAEQIQYLAHHDSLTGLPNRNLLQDRLTQNLAHAHRNGSKSAILFLDFDRFKNINDSLGHSVGDGVLKEVAKRLQNCLRKEDTVARVGGDEFIIVLADLENSRHAGRVAQKITDLGTEPYEISGQKFRLTISIGISLFPEDGDDIDTLLKNADSAMYHAKRVGRNTYNFYTEDMNAQTLEFLNLERDLQQALVHNDFKLHYQPQVHLETGAITGVEALLRWQHPIHGNMPPTTFIPIAEERGLITPIGNWVLETACRQSVAWVQQGLQPVRMAVNISALQLHHADFYEKLAAILTETGMDPCMLELELTESAMMQGEEAAALLLQQLKALGVQLAIDDFGTGYSSLSYLKRFPIDKLKIDRSFIKDLPLDTEDGAITQAIIGVGRSLKHTVIAEGVETLEQQQFLQKEGCDEMQGFYFSRPIPADQLAELLKSNSQER